MVTKVLRRRKIRYGIRKKVRGTAEKPRLSIFRSNKGIYCQLIDDINGKTLASASSIDVKGANATEIATAVGSALAEKATSNNIENVVFDRSGYLYHGRIKALAEAARSGGLKF